MLVSFVPVKLGTDFRGSPLSPAVLLKPTVLIRFLKPKLKHRAGLPSNQWFPSGEEQS